MSLKIHTYKTREQAAKAAGEVLSEHFSHSQPILLLLSGGSSLSILSYLGTLGKLVFSVLDERGDNLESIRKTKLFKDREYLNLTEENLRSWTGSIVVTMGIGSDGHTAGIMPYPENPEGFAKLFNDPNHWVVSYDASGKNPYPHRTSVTLPFLRRVDHAIVFVCGKEKHEALERVLAPSGTLTETPARIIHEMKNVSLFTDIPVTK